MCGNSHEVLARPAVRPLTPLALCRRGGTRQYHLSRGLHDHLTVLQLNLRWTRPPLYRCFPQVLFHRLRSYNTVEMILYYAVIARLCVQCFVGSGVRKSIQPVRNRVMRCWHGCLCGARCKYNAVQYLHLVKKAARVEVNISLAFLHWVRITFHPWPFVSDIAIFVLQKGR